VTRAILHVDMDAFYVGVEVLEDPDLAGRPVVVGGTGNRGVVAAASYEARAYGIHSAMPTGQARRLCRDAVFLPGRFDRYAEYSRRVHDIFRSFTPLVEGIALDEAFLDVSGAIRLFGDAPSIAHEIRRRVTADLGLSCSVGVAPRKLIAKLASEAAKPEPSPQGPRSGLGVVVITQDEELAFLHAHPARALWGVGPATLARLERLGVRTVGDLAALPEATLIGTLGDAAGRHLHALSWARDERPVVPDRPPKSVGHEETFPKDHHRHETLDPEIVRLADSVAGRLRRHNLAGRTVQLKVRFGDFRTITRSATLREPVDTGPRLAAVARELLAQLDPSAGVRLIGVSVSGLVAGDVRQLHLEGVGDDPGGDVAWEQASRAVDEIRERFGDGAIGPAALASHHAPVKREGDQQWGPQE